MLQQNNNNSITTQCELGIKTLNALENSILTFGFKHKAFIRNPYWYFSEKLGYKNRNQVYRWFQRRLDTKVGLNDLKGIVKITKDPTPLEVYVEEVKCAMMEEI